MVDYKELAEISVEESHSWEDDLERGNKGVLENSISNYTLFLENDDKYKDKLKYNEYLREREFDGKEFDDFIMNMIYTDLEKKFYSCNKSKADTAISNVFMTHRYNPVIDYIKSLKWDGKKRIERLFIDLLEADDTPLNREMTRKWMIAALKRTLIPGCKFDNMLVLQGGQGIGKSTICEKLSNGFFSTISLDEIGDKDLVEKLNKTWVAIIDEMDTFNKKEMSTIKTFLSLCEDKVRLAYARNASTFKRHCVFIGSTNDDTFLRDVTSSVERRFWIIKCNKTTKDSKVFDTMTPDYVKQLWAEAGYYLKENPNQYLDISQESMEDFAREQERYKIGNDDNYMDSLKYELDREFGVGIDGEVTDIDQLTTYTSGPKYKINKISSVVLRKYMKDKYHEDRSTKYITNNLSEWEYKDIWFTNERKYIKGYVRKNIIENERKVEDPMEEFTKYLPK